MFPRVLVIGILSLVFFKCALTLILRGQRLDNDLLPDMTETCLGCLCEATSNCNLTIGCMRGLCGPFLISRAYWIDAGRPVLFQDNPDREDSFYACVNDPFCAAQTVKQYMGRFAQDCNKDRTLDCDDYARIHYLGGYQCSLPITQYRYYSVFRQCRDSIRWLSG